MNEYKHNAHIIDIVIIIIIILRIGIGGGVI